MQVGFIYLLASHKYRALQVGFIYLLASHKYRALQVVLNRVLLFIHCTELSARDMQETPCVCITPPGGTVQCTPVGCTFLGYDMQDIDFV